MIQSVCVYCAASSRIDFVYQEAARSLGNMLADNDIHCVLGAGKTGLMGIITDAILAKGRKITGVIPQFMVERNWHHQGLKNLIVTPSMHERKSHIAKISAAAIAMPGGCGTLEELLEIITWKQLGLFPKPVLIVNINNYFDPLISMLEKAINEDFMSAEHGKIWQVVDTVQEILPALRNAPKWEFNSSNFAVV